MAPRACRASTFRRYGSGVIWSTSRTRANSLYNSFSSWVGPKAGIPDDKGMAFLGLTGRHREKRDKPQRHRGGGRSGQWPGSHCAGASPETGRGGDGRLHAKIVVPATPPDIGMSARQVRPEALLAVAFIQGADGVDHRNLAVRGKGPVPVQVSPVDSYGLNFTLKFVG